MCSGACQDSLLGVPLVELISWSSSLKLDTKYAGSEPLRSGSCVSQCRPLLETGPELSGMSNKVFHSWLLSVLNLKVRGKDPAVNQGWPSPVPNLRQLSKRPRELLSLPLPASGL